MTSHLTSATKSIIWRIVGVIVLATITYLYTGSWIQTSLITFIHHGTFLIVFYLHERAWLKWGTVTGIKRKIYKMLTYETLLGNVILGTITYGITGSWKAMGAITLTYIGTKHILYILNEFVWNEK